MGRELVQVGRVRTVATVIYISGVICANTTQWVRLFSVSWLPEDQGEAAHPSKEINQSLQMLQEEDTIIHLHQHYQQCLVAWLRVCNAYGQHMHFPQTNYEPSLYKYF